jgi:glycosyltransferase involved in cell wall biosynthesis
MPNVILEAMANGLAILATDVGATNVLVGNHTGWLINNCEVPEIETALIKIINTPYNEIDLKKQESLKIISEKFVWEKLVLKLVDKLKN